MRAMSGRDFARLIERLGIPEEYLPPSQAEMTMRALALIRIVPGIPDGMSRLMAHVRAVHDPD